MFYAYKNSSPVRGPSQKFFSLASIAILATARVARRWNQTVQKFAGEPDIARAFFSDHKAILWIAVVGAYLWNLRSMANRGFSQWSQNIAGGIATALTAASATFKLAFTSQDSPELMLGSGGPLTATELGLSLVTRARIVFAAIGIALVYTLVTGVGLQNRPNRRSPELILCVQY
jgi:ethanolaminephosphotransferase